MRVQVKSKERVRQRGEVFTNEREVNAMLNLVKKEAVNIDSTFLEPACGDGNFLDEICRRKLDTAFKIAGDNEADFEYWATRAVSTIYGIDIMEDNVQESRDRLYDYFFAAFVNRYKKQPSSICQSSILFILTQNIQHGDTLTMKVGDGSELMMTKWLFDDDNGLTISIFSYRELVDSGCDCTPKYLLPRIPHLLLPAIVRQA